MVNREEAFRRSSEEFTKRVYDKILKTNYNFNMCISTLYHPNLTLQDLQSLHCNGRRTTSSIEIHKLLGVGRDQDGHILNIVIHYGLYCPG